MTVMAQENKAKPNKMSSTNIVQHAAWSRKADRKGWEMATNIRMGNYSIKNIQLAVHKPVSVTSNARNPSQNTRTFHNDRCTEVRQPKL